MNGWLLRQWVRVTNELSCCGVGVGCGCCLIPVIAAGVVGGGYVGWQVLS